MKFNQLRCLLSRGVEVMVVPWDYDFPTLAGKDYDGLFVSNGPGDPATLTTTVNNLSKTLKEVCQSSAFVSDTSCLPSPQEPALSR